MTSANAQPNTTFTERQFLEQQADDARHAMAQTAKLIGKNIGHTVDPRAWTAAHPWIVLTGVAVAGFAGVSLIPKKPKPAPKESQPQTGEEKQEEPEKPGIMRGILAHVFQIGWKWVASALVANIASKMSQGDSPEEADPNNASSAEAAAERS
jgi:hypothetical protein